MVGEARCQTTDCVLCRWSAGRSTAIASKSIANIELRRPTLFDRNHQNHRNQKLHSLIKTLMTGQLAQNIRIHRDHAFATYVRALSSSLGTDLCTCRLWELFLYSVRACVRAFGNREKDREDGRNERHRAKHFTRVAAAAAAAAVAGGANAE